MEKQLSFVFDIDGTICPIKKKDEILYGKPWPGHFGFYVDDRSVRPREFMEHSPEELSEICKRDQWEEVQ